MHLDRKVGTSCCQLVLQRFAAPEAAAGSEAYPSAASPKSASRTDRDLSKNKASRRSASTSRGMASERSDSASLPSSGSSSSPTDAERGLGSSCHACRTPPAEGPFPRAAASSASSGAMKDLNSRPLARPGAEAEEEAEASSPDLLLAASPSSRLGPTLLSPSERNEDTAECKKLSSDCKPTDSWVEHLQEERLGVLAILGMGSALVSPHAWLIAEANMAGFTSDCPNLAKAAALSMLVLEADGCAKSSSR
mmetsp:Transcript_177739/g.569847  ORF Transcript_177739/g.569847 Transcript_177739/m.569847 type:complete len:251 (+) Transcript_177739:5153-5905(+)